MKQNKIMIRRMGEFEVQQRTKDSMFNATALLKQWNKESGIKKEIGHFFENAETKALVKALEEKLLNKHRPTDVLHGGNITHVKTRGRNGGTWMHPYLFIDFAMWINVQFKIDVIEFVYDQLIKYRIESSDNFILMNKALSDRFKRTKGQTPPKQLFMDEARRIKTALSVEDWEDATELQLHYRTELEKGNTKCFNNDKTFKERMLIFDFIVSNYESELIKTIEI